jgi:hypothetical protein
MNIKSLNIEDPSNWSIPEKAWITSFNLHSGKKSHSVQRSCWQLHTLHSIDDWIQKKQAHTLCFDGASKGNQGGGRWGGGFSTNPEEK